MVAMRGVHLEIAGVHGLRGTSVQVDPALRRTDAADDLALSLCHVDLPAVTFETVQLEEVGRAIDAEADVPLHGASHGQVDESPIVGILCLSDLEARHV